MSTDWMPWWLYRLRVRWRMWRNSGPDLNRRTEVEGVLLDAAKNGRGLNAEQCRALAIKLAATICLTSCAHPMSRYHIHLDVYVRDEAALCDQAWHIALERFGLDVAEAVTMSGGVMEPAKCLAVLYQVGSPAQVVSAGIYVRREIVRIYVRR